MPSGIVWNTRWKLQGETSHLLFVFGCPGKMWYRIFASFLLFIEDFALHRYTRWPILCRQLKSYSTCLSKRMAASTPRWFSVQEPMGCFRIHAFQCINCICRQNKLGERIAHFASFCLHRACGLVLVVFCCSLGLKNIS